VGRSKGIGSFPFAALIKAVKGLLAWHVEPGQPAERKVVFRLVPNTLTAAVWIGLEQRRLNFS
jgi:hypothetical protein